MFYPHRRQATKIYQWRKIWTKDYKLMDIQEQNVVHNGTYYPIRVNYRIFFQKQSITITRTNKRIDVKYAPQDADNYPES